MEAQLYLIPPSDFCRLACRPKRSLLHDRGNPVWNFAREHAERTCRGEPYEGNAPRHIEDSYVIVEA
jgi:hypothetical protein